MKTIKPWVLNHATRHQDGGLDEINVGALSGELADPQKTKVDAGTTNPTTGNYVGRLFYNTTDDLIYRWNGSAWVKVSVVDYPDLDNIPSSFTPSAHASTHEKGGADYVDPMRTATFVVSNNSADMPDYTTIQDAITNLPSGSGRIIVLRGSGVYTISSPIDISAKVEIELIGSGRPILYISGTAGFQTPSGASSITLERLRISGFDIRGGSYPSSSVYLVDFQKSGKTGENRLEIDDNKVCQGDTYIGALVHFKNNSPTAEWLGSWSISIHDNYSMNDGAVGRIVFCEGTNGTGIQNQRIYTLDIFDNFIMLLQNIIHFAYWDVANVKIVNNNFTLADLNFITHLGNADNFIGNLTVTGNMFETSGFTRTQLKWLFYLNYVSGSIRITNNDLICWYGNGYGPGGLIYVDNFQMVFYPTPTSIIADNNILIGYINANSNWIYWNGAHMILKSNYMAFRRNGTAMTYTLNIVGGLGIVQSNVLWKDGHTIVITNPTGITADNIEVA